MKVNDVKESMSRLLGYAESETLSHLRVGPSAERLASLTERINVTADSEIASAQARGPAVACGKGCSHCCIQYVTVIIPEVLNLAACIRSTYSAERLIGLQERMRSYLDEVSRVPATKRIGTVRLRCPVLEGDLCGGFEARPLACRRYNSIDVEACIRRKNGERKEPPLANAEQTQIGNYLLSGFAIGLRRSRLQEALVEMIPALEIALRIPDAAERYLAGEPVFDSVIVAGYDPSEIRRAIKARSSLGIPVDN